MQTKNVNLPTPDYEKRRLDYPTGNEEGPYKPVPPPKPVSHNQKNNQNGQQDEQREQTVVERSSLRTTSGPERTSVAENGQVRSAAGQPFAPEYRMPPLYGEEQSSGQAQQAASLQTHSSKFPIERELVLSSGDKNSKIPILHEYKQRTTGRVAIAPDAPIKQQAWVQEGTQMQEVKQDGQARNYQSQDTYSSTSGAVPRTTKIDEEKTKSLSRTYHTIKDMISSRFGPSRKDVEPEAEASLNNVTEELRKSSRSIDDDEARKKEGIYGKPRAQEPSVNVQQYTKNAYGQYGHSYVYQSNQQNVPLPGQLQPTTTIQPNLPGQSAQLHVTHHTPPGGVQTVHQTQVSAFGQTATGAQQVQNVTREYMVQAPGGMTGQQMHQGIHQSPAQGQGQGTQKLHGLSVQQHQVGNAIPPTSQSFQSPQQLLHQNQNHHQSPRFAQQHAQNLHQRQLIQQMHQQQMAGQPNSQTAGARNVQQSYFANSVSYQQYQQARQAMSRSQIDLPSTSRQAQELRVSGQEVYYHYAQGRPRYGVPQVYMKAESTQETEFQRRNSAKGIEKAASQPQLCYEDERNAEAAKNPVENMKNLVDALDKERYEITVEDRSQETAGRNGSQRNEEYRPETSFGIRRDETRTSKKEQEQGSSGAQEVGQNTVEGNSVQKRIEELQKRAEQEGHFNSKPAGDADGLRVGLATKMIGEASKRLEGGQYAGKETVVKSDSRKDDLEQGIGRLKIQNQGSGSDYDKAGQSSSNVDSGRGSAIYSSGRRPPPDDQTLAQVQDSEWVDIVESELRSILEPRDVPAMAHSTLSESVSSVTPPLPPLSPHDSPRTPRNRYSTSLPYGSKPNYSDYSKAMEKRGFSSNTKHRGASSSKKEAAKKFSHLFGVEAADLTSTTTGLDLDSMLDRSDSDLSTTDARTIRKQLEGLENMYSEVLKLLGGSVKKRRKARGLTSYGSVSSLPTSSVSSRPVTRHHDKRRSHVIDDRMKKAKDIKSINKRFQRLESHVVTLARSVAHLSSEMRTQHLMIQEMESIKCEIATLRTQTSMAMVRSQSQPLIKDSELPALSNPSRVKKLTKFFGTEPPLIRLFLRELGYEKYAAAFEKEKVGMVELPYLSEDRLQKMGVPLGPRLRILQEARISVCKDPIYVV
ncbi:uncharacterized protein LOC114940490 isoform X2 [Nylanderia fulva]|uniref:uncharacterized protein LOC114940490 isoform X2 n=1 Tax=Nylanderia fulva TaxID=613905 RepID=UPI0010FAF198|nr:uncharacterized protein LOC114940490 isoform X2 [Nylanderia fulva]XP_029171026.1 uncharacterized protein LOC114940490 isoform X2 [Nylanderia fulva]